MYALGLPGKYNNVSRNAQKVPLSKNIKIAVAPLVLTPFVPFRAPREEAPELRAAAGNAQRPYALGSSGDIV